MPIELWLDQPVWLIYACLALLFALFGWGIRLVVYGRLTRPWATSLSGVVAPFFESVAILFGLLTGFVANDAWERNRQASRAILTERDNLAAIYALSIATVSDMSEIRAAVRAYLESVIADEWPRMTEGHASQKTGAALGELMRDLSDPKISVEAGLVAHSTLLDLCLRVRSARSDRLALSEQESDHAKWLTMLALGLLTMAAIGLVHPDKPRAQAVAMTLFSAAAIAVLGLIAIKERPFDGPLRLPPTALRETLATFDGAVRPPASGDPIPVTPARP